jgi:hypothetical protein
VEVVEAVFAVFLVRLFEDTDDDATLDDAQAAAFDGFLEFGLASVDDGVPFVAGAVDFVHRSFGAGRVGVAGVLGEDGADQGVEDGRGVAAACSCRGGDDFFWSEAGAMEGDEDAVGEFALFSCWVREVWEG